MRNAQASACGAAAAGCRQGGRLVCGGAMGQRPGRTVNISPMLVTCATSQSRGWLKSRASCQVRRGGGKEYAQARAGCRAGMLQARLEARVRWRDGAAARAYIEHAVHARDLRDVPVQGLVEAGRLLPGAERREARSALRRAWGGEAAGGRQGGRLACGGAMGQRPGRTANIQYMFVTCATSQSKDWLKLETPCQVRREVGEECSGKRVWCSGGGLQARRQARVRGARLGSGPGVPGTCIPCS